MEITINKASLNRFTREVKKEALRRIARAMPEVKKTLIRTSLELASEIITSQEWKEMKTPKRIAEFGFQPWEVDELDEVVNRYLVPGKSNITQIEIATSVGAPRAILHWVDWPALLNSPFALHDLTKRNIKTKGWMTTSTVSWLEWFEYGVTINDWDVEYPLSPRLRWFSRSGLGLMIQSEGSSWSFPGTYLFDRTSKGFKTKIPRLNKEIKAVIIKSMRQK